MTAFKGDSWVWTHGRLSTVQFYRCQSLQNKKEWGERGEKEKGRKRKGEMGFQADWVRT